MTQTLDVIIAGGGRVGFQTAAMLDDQGHTVTIIESDEKRCGEIADEYVATVIEGDATRPDILEQSGLDDADVIAGLTGTSGINLAICMEATQMAPNIRTVARIDQPEGRAYTRFVDAILYPERAGARVATNQILGSDVQTLADVTGTLDIMQIRVADGAPAAGKELAAVNLPTGALVISDDDGERVARPDTTLTPGKRYVVAVEPSVADEVMNLLRG